MLAPSSPTGPFPVTEYTALGILIVGLIWLLRLVLFKLLNTIADNTKTQAEVRDAIISLRQDLSINLSTLVTATAAQLLDNSVAKTIRALRKESENGTT